MDTKKVVYFIARSENVPNVLQEALNRSVDQQVSIFFDLDGTHALDKQYAQQLSSEKQMNLLEMYEQLIAAGVKMYACQLNVMSSCQLHCIDGVESAGVITFLEYAYEADTIFSY